VARLFQAIGFSGIRAAFPRSPRGVASAPPGRGETAGSSRLR
jgi:hypothetical protein